MSVRYAPSHVDALFEQKDYLGIYTLIDIRAEQGTVLDECILFSRLLEWVGSTRSGVWQYYENLKQETYDEVIRILEKFEMHKIKSKYQEGMASWQAPVFCAELDQWIDEHEEEIYSEILRHASHIIPQLKINAA